MSGAVRGYLGLLRELIFRPRPRGTHAQRWLYDFMAQQRERSEGHFRVSNGLVYVSQEYAQALGEDGLHAMYGDVDIVICDSDGAA